MNECYECVDNDTLACMYYNNKDKKKLRKKMLSEIKYDCFVDLSTREWCKLLCGGEEE